MTNSYIVNLNGKIGSPEETKISVFDRGFLYGDSVYEVTCTQDRVLLFLNEHLLRLRQSANAISLPIPFSDHELRSEIIKTINAFPETEEVMVRFIITRGVGEFGLGTKSVSSPNFIIMARPFRANPQWWYDKGVNFIVSDVVINSPMGQGENAIKSGNYLNNVVAFIQAEQAGASDALLVNQDGNILEGTTNSFWMVKNGIVITPPLSLGILKGITRQKVIALTKEAGIPLEERPFNREYLLSADECFFTSSTKAVVPITEIDGHKIGAGKPGPISARLLELYRNFIKNYTKEVKAGQKPSPL